jgi:hypothetical protein
MLKKILIYAVTLRKLHRMYDKKLLFLLLIPPAVLLAKRIIPAGKPALKRSLAACLMGAATAQIELMSLKMQRYLEV